MVKTETIEMMNIFEKLVLHSRLMVYAHVLCDIPFFYVQLCLQSWSTHVKGRG